MPGKTVWEVGAPNRPLPIRSSRSSSGASSRWWIDPVLDAGAVGDGSDETAKIATCINLAVADTKPILIARNYGLSDLAIDAPVTFFSPRGATGARFTRLSASSRLMTLNYLDSGPGARFEGLYLVGHASATTHMIRVQNAGNPIWDTCFFTDDNSGYIEFDADKGNGSRIARCTKAGSTKYLVILNNDTSDIARFLTEADTSGSESFDLDLGGRALIVQGGLIAKPRFGTTSRGLLMSGTYVGNTSTLTVKGDEHVITGCFLPGTAVTLDTDTERCIFLGNNNGTASITNNGTDNIVDHNA